MRGANNVAAKRIVDSLKSILSLVVVDGKKGGKYFVTGDGEGLCEKDFDIFSVARHKVLAPFFVVDDDSHDSIDLRLSTILFAASLFTPRTKRVCW